MRRGYSDIDLRFERVHIRRISSRQLYRANVKFEFCSALFPHVRVATLSFFFLFLLLAGVTETKQREPFENCDRCANIDHIPLTPLLQEAFDFQVPTQAQRLARTRDGDRRAFVCVSEQASRALQRCHHWIESKHIARARAAYNDMQLSRKKTIAALPRVFLVLIADALSA